MRNLVVGLSLAFFASAAAAQQIARPDPADPSARSPKPVYRSAFAAYRPWAETEVARWRESNEEVGRLGGHVGHAGRAKPKPAAAAGGEVRR